MTSILHLDTVEALLPRQLIGKWNLCIPTGNAAIDITTITTTTDVKQPQPAVDLLMSFEVFRSNPAARKVFCVSTRCLRGIASP